PRAILSSYSSTLLLLLKHPAPTALSPLSLHDALPISRCARAAAGAAGDRLFQRPLARRRGADARPVPEGAGGRGLRAGAQHRDRSEEHTSELQSLTNLVCRLLLEKKKSYNNHPTTTNT